MLKLASRVNALKPSSIMEIAAKAAELKAKGFDVVSLAAGEPDFNTPEPIQRAATQAMADGITKYTPAPGFLALREALAAKITSDNGFPVSPEDIIVTSGAKHSLYLALQCLIEPGDAVLLPTPAWVSYTSLIEFAGAQIIPLPLFEEDGYRANVDRWKGMAIPANARGIILNSPNNPTGVVYRKQDLIRLVGWALQRNLWILADEIYEKILYDGATHTSIASLGPEVRNHTITVSGFSKTYCMTGWRFGWTIAEPELIAKMTALQSQSTTHVTSFVQSAAIAATKLPSSVVTNLVGAFEKRRNYCIERLDRLSESLTYVKPDGAFYFFLNLSKFLNQRKMSEAEFCRELLAKYHVGVVPGSSFGKDKCIRISYATAQENLAKAFDRIETFLKS